MLLSPTQSSFRLHEGGRALNSPMGKVQKKRLTKQRAYPRYLVRRLGKRLNCGLEELRAVVLHVGVGLDGFVNQAVLALSTLLG
jgi:hypothetical protein